MALPTIRKPTVAPSRKMARDVYPIVADEWAASIGPFTEDLIVAISWMGQQVTDVADYKDQAAASAKAAAKSVEDAAAQVKLATDQAQASKVSADAAAASLASVKVVAQAVDAAAGLPPTNLPGGVLRQKYDGTGKEWWVPVINRVGDLVVSPSLPDSSFLLDDNKYSQSQWPELFAKIGAVGFDPMADIARMNAAPTVSLSNASSWNDAAMGQNDVVIAVDSGGRIFDVTAASPSDYAKYVQPSGYVFSAIATDGKGVFVACGTSGAFVRSINSGQTWAIPTLPSGTNSFSWATIATDSNGTWYAFTNGAAGSPVLKSTDNGATWQNITFASMGLTANYSWQLSYDGVGAWYATAPAGLYDVFKSTNGGLTWTTTVRPPNAVASLTNNQYGPQSVNMSRIGVKGNALAFASWSSSSQGSYTYYYWILVYSYDGGVTWQYLPLVNSGQTYVAATFGAVTFAGDNTLVLNDLTAQYAVWTVKNFNAGRKSPTVTSYRPSGISGGNFRNIPTNGLGTYYLLTGSAVKKVSPIYDPKTLFYVPKFPEQPFPFQSYVKARTIV